MLSSFINPSLICCPETRVGDISQVPAAHLKLMVGLGSQTKQKSATKAIMTLASTKSSSWPKFSPRLVYSAVPLAHIPIPICNTGPRWENKPDTAANEFCSQDQRRLATQKRMTLLLELYLNAKFDKEARIC